MTGVDPSPQSIAAASAHASQSHLDIEYINGTTNDLVGAERRFDVVLALEVVEHVPDLAAFLASCVPLLKPGGLLILSTLNRTAKSFALGIVAAEYVLRWLPRGTHDWSRFVTPQELRNALTKVGLISKDEQGLSFNPLGGEWHLSSDCAVNYFMTASSSASRNDALSDC
jgi:2-polyprenyl-6-hydroxyphenyl methylase/3-demethylubiquinone-9 3-methyltransferase